MVMKRTFKEWWNNLPESLKEKSQIIENMEIDKHNKSIKKINYILIELTSNINCTNNYINNFSMPTLDEFKHWFDSGQLFE